jgi:two-component system, cell cycle response regulator
MSIRIVLIEDDYGDAELVGAYLEDEPDQGFHLLHAPLLEEGAALLQDGGADVVLLDLNLPDSSGLTTFTSLHARFPDIPIIVLSGLDDREISIMAVREGAQDFILKGVFDGGLLSRAIHHAIERHQLYRKLVGAAFSDELTGLFNRRGFLTLAGQMFKSAQRLSQGAFLLYTDLDGMKTVNDVLGHREGDRMLRDTAEVLRETFRDADVLARLGGDEFAVFGLQEAHFASVDPKARLLAKVGAFNATGKRPYTLSMSIGLSCLECEPAKSLDDLVMSADASMYEEKRCRSKRCGGKPAPAPPPAPAQVVERTSVPVERSPSLALRAASVLRIA